MGNISLTNVPSSAGFCLLANIGSSMLVIINTKKTWPRILLWQIAVTGRLCLHLLQPKRVNRLRKRYNNRYYKLCKTSQKTSQSPLYPQPPTNNPPKYPTKPDALTFFMLTAEKEESE